MLRPSLAERGCHCSAVRNPGVTQLGPSPHRAVEETATFPAKTPHVPAAKLSCILASSTVLAESSVNSFPVAGARGTAACRDPSWWDPTGEQEWALPLFTKPRALLGGLVLSTSPSDTEGCAFTRASSWLWCYPHPPGLVSAAWCPCTMPSTRTLLRHTCATAKSSFWGSLQRQKLSTALMHSPSATASQDTKALRWICSRNRAGFLYPHTNRPIFRLFLYHPVLRIFSAPTRAATQGCPPSPQELL